jgi:hypothetical protein
MPIVTRANIRDLGRLLCRDTSTTQPGLSDANWNLLIDKALFAYAMHAEGDDVLFSSESDTLSSGSNTATVAFADSPLKIEAVYLSGVKKLKRATIGDVLQKQAEDPNASGEPEFFAFEFGEDRTDATLYVDLKADQNYTAVTWYRKEPTAFSGDSVVCPFGDGAAYAICMMAAFDACIPLGRSGEYASRIVASLPDSLRSAVLQSFRSGTHGGADPRRAA